ncbi:thioredoxin, partial [Lactobacillus salivarius]|nr:thioredoxin [Ligilactobacillus salivarius]
DVDTKVGRNLVSAYGVRKAATSITFRNGRVNKYLYAQKVGDTYESKKSVLKVIFRE